MSEFTQADIDKAVEAAVEAVKAKNTELLDEVKKLKADMRKTQEIKPEHLADLEAQVEELRGKLTTAEKAATTAAKAKETAEAALKAEQGFTHKLLVENGLREQAVANGITHPAHQKAVIAMLSSQVQITADGENRVAKVGDKALADHFKEWAGSDEGKAFVSAPNNTGGGAPRGSTANGNTPSITRAQLSGLDPRSQAEAGRKAAKGELQIIDNAA